jgi:hypothetical protein
MEYFLGLLAAGVITGTIGGWVAKEKGRDRTEGFLFGFFLSIPGLIIEGLLPTKPMAPPAPAGSRSASLGPHFTMVGEKPEIRDSRDRKSMPNL